MPVDPTTQLNNRLSSLEDALNNLSVGSGSASLTIDDVNAAVSAAVAPVAASVSALSSELTGNLASVVADLSSKIEALAASFAAQVAELSAELAAVKAIAAQACSCSADSPLPSKATKAK